jgi:hypothetical protein
MENGMNKSYSTHQRTLQTCSHYSEDLKGREQDVYGKIIAKTIFTVIVCDGMDWMPLAQHRNQAQAVVNTGMNLSVP